MKRRALWLMVSVAVISTFAFAPVAFGATLTTEIQAALTATQQMVNTTLQAGQATNLATARSLAQSAVASGQTAVTHLQTALPLATDDATRSRISALITHLQAAIAAGNLAVSGPDAEVKSRIDAMRGEAQETLNEFAPLGLPSAGGPGLVQLASMASLGSVTLLLGFGLRYVRSRIS